MSTLESLRRTKHLAYGVLLWFALSLGVAMAAPLVHPQAMSWVCSASGSAKLVDTTDAGGTGSTTGKHHALDCVLCLPWIAPPPGEVFGLAATATGSTAPAELHLAVLDTRPLGPQSARGPPA